MLTYLDKKAVNPDWIQVQLTQTLHNVSSFIHHCGNLTVQLTNCNIKQTVPYLFHVTCSELAGESFCINGQKRTIKYRQCIMQESPLALTKAKLNFPETQVRNKLSNVSTMKSESKLPSLTYKYSITCHPLLIYICLYFYVWRKNTIIISMLPQWHEITRNLGEL